jgi:hypothetical protein
MTNIIPLPELSDRYDAGHVDQDTFNRQMLNYLIILDHVLDFDLVEMRGLNTDIQKLYEELGLERPSGLTPPRARGKQSRQE